MKPVILIILTVVVVLGLAGMYYLRGVALGAKSIIAMNRLMHSFPAQWPAAAEFIRWTGNSALDVGEIFGTPSGAEFRSTMSFGGRRVARFTKETDS
jgi:hypothetical protein